MLSVVDGINEQIKDYSTNIVLIEPLATVAAIEDFLFPRIKVTHGEGCKKILQKNLYCFEINNMCY
jgi:hypothetical protein